jgi:hypothetical protein
MLKSILELLIGLVAGLAFLLGGIWIFAWDFAKIQRASDSKDWPQADGVVTVSKYVQKGRETWPYIEYTYTVTGVRYTSQQISFDLFNKPGGKGRVQSIVERYPVGQAVTVYYDPNNPAIAILEPGDYSPFYVPLLLAVVPTIGGLLMLWVVAYRLAYGNKARGGNRRRDWKSIGKFLDSHHELPRNMALRMQFAVAGLTSIVIYTIFVLVSFESSAREVAVQAFGPRPLAIPNIFFVMGLGTLLFLPVPWIIWHLTRVSWQARKDALHSPLFFLIYLCTVGKQHPELQRSQWICVGGIGYFFAVAASWIVYASILGI